MLTLVDFFCGAGGSSQGAAAVPGVEVKLAANHWARAVESHAANFPAVDHYRGDIRDTDVSRLPAGELFWASPECPKWSNARGKQRDFDRQPDLFGETLPDEADERSRALMWDVPRYLTAMQLRGRPVLAGVVENVVDVRAWNLWHTWVADIANLGYRTRLIALNSMHARPTATPPAPQSRDRLYLAYWAESLGRDPDWDKWLRPVVHCDTCGVDVRAVQAFKKPGRDMGRYRTQYTYRCPNVTCRNTILEPAVLPAAAAIDWTLPGTRIGDRPDPLSPNTLDRIRAGLDRYAHPVMVPAGGTRRQDAMTARNETRLAWLPFITELRGGSSDARPVTESLATVTASGNHHGLVTPAAMVLRNNGSHGDGGEHYTPTREPLPSWQHLLVPYYSTGTAKPVTEPVGTVSTVDRYALAAPAVDIDDVLWRMLEPHEIGTAMAFGTDYRVLGNKRERVRQYGNAVTPPAAEILIAALVETITGKQPSAAT